MKYVQIIYVKKETINLYNHLLDLPAKENQIEDLGYPEDSTIDCFTVFFEDGCFADVKLCSGQSNFFCDPVLYDKGYEAVVLDCADQINGEFQFAYKNNIYIVIVKEEETMMDYEDLLHEVRKYDANGIMHLLTKEQKEGIYKQMRNEELANDAEVYINNIFVPLSCDNTFITRNGKHLNAEEVHKKLMQYRYELAHAFEDKFSKGYFDDRLNYATIENMWKEVIDDYVEEHFTDPEQVCIITVDVQKCFNGDLDVYISEEGSSGSHYVVQDTKTIGSLVEEEIQCFLEAMDQ